MIHLLLTPTTAEVMYLQGWTYQEQEQFQALWATQQQQQHIQGWETLPAAAEPSFLKRFTNFVTGDGYIKRKQTLLD